MKSVPFVNHYNNCLLNCLVMVLDYFQPWASPDAQGQTQAPPSDRHQWIKGLARQLGIGDNFLGRDGPNNGASMMDCPPLLRGQGLSVALCSSGAKGWLPDRLFIESLDWYDRSNHLIIACVAYPHLPQGRDINHAVVIVGGNPDEVIYHDPGLHNGAYRRVSRKQFMKAWHLASETYSRFHGSLNMLAAWDQDRTPDLWQLNHPQKVSHHTKASVSYSRGLSSRYKQLHQPLTQDQSRHSQAIMNSGPEKILTILNHPQNILSGLETGILLAQKFKSELDLVCIHSESHDSVDINQLKTSTSLHSSLDKINHYWHFDQGELKQRIPHAVEQYQPDLIVVGAREATKAAYLGLNFTYPLWIEKGVNELKQEKWNPILVPMDDSPFSYLALQEAISLAQLGKTKVIVLNVGDEKTKEKLTPILNHVHWQGVKHELIFKSGEVSSTILATQLEFPTSLIVMGTMGQGHPLDDDPQHSVTEQIIRKSPVSVYVVHPQPRLERVKSD